MSVPPSIAVFVDIHGNVPGVAHDLVIRTAGALPLANFYRALGFDIAAGTTADGAPAYLGRSVGLALTIIPAAETAPVGIGKLHFLVDDVDAAVRLVKAEGGRVVRQVTPYQRRAMVTDPDGRNVVIGERSAYSLHSDDPAFDRPDERLEARLKDPPPIAITGETRFTSRQALRRSTWIHRISSGANLFGQTLLAIWVFLVIGLDFVCSAEEKLQELTTWPMIARLLVLSLLFLAVGRGVCVVDGGTAGGLVKPLIATGLDLLILSIVFGFWGFDVYTWLIIVTCFYASSILFTFYMGSVASALRFERTAAVADFANGLNLVACLFAGGGVLIGMASRGNPKDLRVAVDIAAVALALGLLPQIVLLLSFSRYSAKTLYVSDGTA